MKYSILIAIVIILCVPVVTSAASFEFTESESPIMIGDTIRVSIYIDAKIDAEDESVSIADLRIMFPRESLWAKSFTVAPGWLIAPGEEYNAIDNGRGTLRATAGFEGSFSRLRQDFGGQAGRALFGTLEFIAVGEGVAEVSILKSSVISNAKNENIFVGVANTISVEISPQKNGDASPSQLFDIRLLLEREVFSPEDPITFRAHFNSFGTIPTPVEMFLTVTDESGKIFATSDENLVVETDALFTKRLEHINLPPGAYEMHMHTRYNVDVEDDFHVSFLVRRQFSPFLIVFGVILVALFGLLIISKRHNYGHKSK